MLLMVAIRMGFLSIITLVTTMIVDMTAVLLAYFLNLGGSTLSGRRGPYMTGRCDPCGVSCTTSYREIFFLVLKGH